MIQLGLDEGVQVRRRLEQAKEDAGGQRPTCDLVFSTEVTEDGYVFLHISCLRHGATWRELCAVVDANGLNANPATATGVAKAARAGACAEVKDSGPDEGPLDA